MSAWHTPTPSSLGDVRRVRNNLCPVPNPLESEEAWESYYHLDLDRMSRFTLILTRARLLMRLARDQRPHPWLLERFQQVQRRLARER